MSALHRFIRHDPERDHSLLKTLTFACTHFTVAFTVAYLLTNDILIGSLLAMIEPAINTVAYFFHEKLWARAVETRRGRAAIGSGSEALGTAG